MRCLWISGVLLAMVGCEQQNPLARAEPIGEYPAWGQDFVKDPNQASEGSLLMPTAGGDAAEGPVPSGESANPGQTGGSAVPAKNPMAAEDWSGGDAALGKTVFLNNCALCHGADGRGGQKMGMVVPTLRNPAWHAKVSDNHIASTVSHGKGQMPSFMGKLDKAQLQGLVAYVRTLKAAPDKAPAAAEKAAPAGEDEAKKDDEDKDDEGGFGEGW